MTSFLDLNNNKLKMFLSSYNIQNKYFKLLMFFIFYIRIIKNIK